MLREANLIRIVGISLIAVDSLGAIRILDLVCLRRGHSLVLHAATEAGGAASAGVERGAGGTAGVSGDGGGGLEAVELGGGVELGLGREGGGGVGGLGGHLAGGVRVGGVFVEGVRVDEGAVGGLGLGAVVEDPDDLWGESVVGFLEEMGIGGVLRSWRAK